MLITAHEPLKATAAPQERTEGQADGTHTEEDAQGRRVGWRAQCRPQGSPQRTRLPRELSPAEGTHSHPEHWTNRTVIVLGKPRRQDGP